MKYYKDYIEVEPKVVGKRKKFDNNIYVLDIETTSYIIFEGKVYPAKHYKDLNEKQKKMCKVGGFMYIWQLSVNDTVYYGRTYRELDEFLRILENEEVKKIIFVHNLSFEFQYLKGYFKFKEVQARKSRHVMRCEFEEFNIRLQCSYYMSNCALKSLPKLFNLDVEKMVGDLDYSLLRNTKTPLDEKELKYCENDCLVVYKYILRELETYERVDKIPMTSTGKVRKELKDLIKDDWAYKGKISKIYNEEPEIYAMLCEVFAGGYTHANYIHSTRILENVDSYDETSAYPYVMVAYNHFPMSPFRRCYIKKLDDLRPWNCYLLKVKFTGLECKYFNTFISSSKCRHIRGGAYDNGRIISAKELEISVTDVDLKFICDTYKFDTIEFIESFYAIADYLPKKLINFILDKYVAKTELKGVEGKELAYNKIKNLFNGIYGMTVTNMICDKVIYDNKLGWDEKELTNDEICEALLKEKKKGFLVFAWGIFVTSIARDCLLRRVIENDYYCAYCDTDSQKLLEGYNKEVIEEYNKSVIERLKKASQRLKIPLERFMPKDKKGNERPLGVFDFEKEKYNKFSYEKFITQGAKKYAYIENIENSKIKKDYNVIEKGKDYSKVLKITVSGVPKVRS